MTGESKGYLKVGAYIPETEDREAVIEREWYGQGHIFKDEDAFLHHPERVCYVPELSDSAYTRQDFLDMCNGQEEFAAECFYAVDWQHPETWLEEQYVHEEWGWCADCEKIYDMEGEPCPCPECGAPPESERESIETKEAAPSLSSQVEEARVASAELAANRDGGVSMVKDTDSR